MPTTTTTTTTTLIPTTTTEIVLVGSGNNLFNVEYSTNGASVVYSKDLGSLVAGITFAEKTNKAYVSTISNVCSYAVSYYANSSSNTYTTSETYEVISSPNTDGNLISTYRKDDNSLWAVQSYNGKVVKMNPDDLSIIKTYDNIDAPYKIRYSAFHNAYFVAGSHILWKIDSLDTVTAVYEINDYILKDFDVSETGIICMLFRGNTDDIIRIVKNDLYTLVLDKKVGAGTVAFCKYCNAGIFYFLIELQTGTSIYSCVHYVFDVSTNSLRSISSEDSILSTTTTTTLSVTTKAVKVTSPGDNEKIQVGQQFDIKWISSKSINDSVKIELYKGTVLYDTLSLSTLNTGIFSWNVSDSIEDGDDYNIKITWLSASNDPNNYDTGSYFSVLKNVSTTTTSTTTMITAHAIGIDYSPASNQILIILMLGSYMIFNLSNMVSYGLMQLGIFSPTAMATRSMVIPGSTRQTKFRLFVGSQMYSADKWDSGVITSDLKSCYYGGGNNLKNGEVYYVHLQTYSEIEGWSELQISEFVFPK